MREPRAVPIDATAAAALATDAAALAAECGHPGLAERLGAAAARVRRPTTVVAVVGGFKQGKSALVNGLAGAEVVPVDPDLGTCVVTVVRHGDERGAWATPAGGDPVAVEPASVGELVSEAGNPDNDRALVSVEVAGPYPGIPAGMAIVDTPGLGGLRAGLAAATLAFLPSADALLFVKDAGAELTQTDVNLLTAARDRCPEVLVCLTKIDLSPDSRRMTDLDRGHLAARGLPLDVFAVSATLRRAALARGDEELDRRSGYPALLAALAARVTDPARTVAAQRVVDEVRAALDHLASIEAGELAVTGADAGRDQAIAEAQARIHHLAGRGGHWRSRLHERVSDTGNEAQRRLHAGLRSLADRTTRAIGAATTSAEWDALAADLQAGVADTATAVLAFVEAGIGEAVEDAVALLDAGDLALPEGWLDAAALELPAATPTLGDHRGARHLVTHGGAAVERVATGVDLLGLLGRLVPAGVGALLMANPVMLGAGVLLGGRAVADSRRRALDARRVDAADHARLFVERATFELGNHVAELVSRAHRLARDALSARVAELEHGYAQVLEAAATATLADAETQAARRAQQADLLTRIQRLRARTDP
jgi:hypothetical protein